MYMREGSAKDLLIMLFLVTSSSFANLCPEATVSLTRALFPLVSIFARILIRKY